MGMLQMTWQPSLLKSLKRKHGAPPLGLRNLGNTCYLNSVLQCLTYTPPLANFCLRFLHSSICEYGGGKEKKGDCPFCILERRIARSLNSEAVSDAPLKINSCLRIYAQHFRNGRQEDAHEFLRYVIDACHNTCLRLKKLQQQQRGKGGIANGGDDSVTGETIVREIFGGALQSQIKCLSCGTESNKVDEIMDISLDILHSGSLKEALQKFFLPEILDGNNKYKCDNCKKLVAARKQMSVLQTPNVLVIQLKRFEGMFGGKIDKTIAFDETLVLSNHMSKGSKAWLRLYSHVCAGEFALRMIDFPVNVIQDQHPEYNLFGTIVHSGFSPGSGHYYAYIKDAVGRWYCCNDSYVSVSTLQEVLSEKVYILFFSRTKQRPQSRFNSVAYESKSHKSHGNKLSLTNSSGCLDKANQTTQVANYQPMSTILTNGTKSSICKPDCLEKPVNMKFSSSQRRTNNSSSHLSTNGNKGEAIQRYDCVETPDSKKELSHNHSETYEPLASFETNCRKSPGEHNSAIVAQQVNIKGSNHHSQTDDSTQCKLDQGIPSQHRVPSNSSTIKENHTPGNLKMVVCKKESLVENAGVSIRSMKEEKAGLQSNGRHGISKMLVNVLNKKDPCSSGINNGEEKVAAENGAVTVDSSSRRLPEANGSEIVTAAQESLKHIGDPGKKRRIEDGSCIFLTRVESLARVEEFKESIVKEASAMLQSSGWPNEVYDFMHARKKLCQGADVLSLNERKSLLIADAKRTFISKVPEKLKARLVECLRLFSQEQQSSGT